MGSSSSNYPTTIVLCLDCPLGSMEAVATKSIFLAQFHNQSNIHIELLSCANELYSMYEVAFMTKQLNKHTHTNIYYVILTNFYENYQGYYLIGMLNNRCYVAPNNGVLSLISNLEKFDRLYIHATKGLDFYKTLPLIIEDIKHSILHEDAHPAWSMAPIEKLRRYLPLQPVINATGMQGHIVHIDDYGNAITNIRKDVFYRLVEGKKYTINLGFDTVAIDTIGAHYASVPKGEVVSFFNAMDLLEIAQNQGNASRLLGLMCIYQKEVAMKRLQTTVRIDTIG